MSQNKNHRQKMSFDNPEVEGEFLEESADSMLSVSDSRGNMDHSDTIMMTEIDRSKLDDYGIETGLEDEVAPKTPRARLPRAPRQSKTPPQNTFSKTSEILKSLPFNTESLKPYLEKAQDFLKPYNEEISKQYEIFSRELKARTSKVDKAIKTQPYLFAFGAVVAGFALSRIVPSSSSSNSSPLSR
ncbi:MAG: hypothetical protein H7249_07450 [Chitinophagaceae bacterium]|nr:hypothetical protein [Oligoflexus sp.]